MNFNAYDSRTIVIHKKIIMKLTLMYIWQAFVSFSASDIVSWPSISFVLRHKYDASTTEDLIAACNELVSSWKSTFRCDIHFFMVFLTFHFSYFHYRVMNYLMAVWLQITNNVCLNTCTCLSVSLSLSISLS